MQVGVIGVGRMSKAMARNLLKAGHRLHVFNTAKEPLQELGKAGAAIAASAKDTFKGDAVISMLPNDDTMRAVFVQGDVLPAGGTSTIHVNMATASVACAEELTTLHRQRGVPYVTATVWGRPNMAAAAKLSIAVAGDAKAIDGIQPLLDAVGQRSTRVGDESRMANVAKTCGAGKLTRPPCASTGTRACGRAPSKCSRSSWHSSAAHSPRPECRSPARQ